MPQTRSSKLASSTKPADAPAEQKGAKPAPKMDLPPAVPARARRKGRIEVPVGTRTTAASKVTKAEENQPKSAVTKPGKTKTRAGLSALGAAATVLEGLKGAEAREGIGANALIERMQRASLWTSPGGKTPAATLYAAMTREIAAKKGDARFARVSPGRFAFKAAAKARLGGGAE